MLAAAAALACDACLDVCQIHNIPPGSLGRAKALAARIAGLPATEDPSTWLPVNSLLLQPEWIRANAPALLSISTDALRLDGQQAVRTIHAHIAYSDEVRTDEVQYDIVLRDGQ